MRKKAPDRFPAASRPLATGRPAPEFLPQARDLRFGGTAGFGFVRETLVRGEQPFPVTQAMEEQLPLADLEPQPQFLADERLLGIERHWHVLALVEPMAL